MVCTAHRLQCMTLHFPRHKFPLHAAEINCIKATLLSPKCTLLATPVQLISFPFNWAVSLEWVVLHEENSWLVKLGKITLQPMATHEQGRLK